MDQKVIEGKARPAGDDDAGRVADQRRGAADVGCKCLGHQKRCRADLQPVANQQRDRGDQQHRGDVVQQGRSERGDQHQQDHDTQRGPVGTFGGPDRGVFEDAGLPQYADDDHHPQQQKDDVPVDSGVAGIKHVVGIDDRQGDHDRSARQRHQCFVDAFGGHQRVGGKEHDDRDDAHRFSGAVKASSISEYQCFNAAASRRDAVITPSNLPSLTTATSMMVSSACADGTLTKCSGSTSRTFLPPNLSAVRSAMDSLSTPASEGSSCTYRGTMNRTTWEAGSTANGFPELSVTTIPGRRCSASRRAAASASESAVTTGKSSASSAARIFQTIRSGAVRPAPGCWPRFASRVPAVAAYTGLMLEQIRGPADLQYLSQQQLGDL